MRMFIVYSDMSIADVKTDDRLVEQTNVVFYAFSLVFGAAMICEK